MIYFYTTALPHCSCGKGATVSVMGTGNVLYDICCDKCGKRRVKELTKAWEKKSPEVQRRQIKETRPQRS